jgi:SSS family solute:Na+ symporter
MVFVDREVCFMNAYHLFLIVLFIYISFLVLTGIYFNRKQKTQKDFWLAGKSAGFLQIGFSAAASWLTAGALLAVIGFYILLGMGSIWGFVAPNIIALFIIAFLVKKIKSLPAITQPELLELRYGNYLRLPIALIITVVMILFAVADIKGFAMVLQIFYGVSPLYSALIVGLAVAVYVTLGGLSAVIATDVVQFICLSLFILAMTFVVLSGASTSADMSWGQILSSAPEGWWNPASIGLPMILIFVLAIIPGWITEQDPWQRVWAAKDNKSARNGMFLGSLLVALVFGGCAIIALGLNVIYPEIAKMGFPMGMAKAEPALLTFIMDSNFSSISLALCAVALATAAMSCTDTFAVSGASCISRDIFQRYLVKDASLKHVLLVNRLSVLLIVFLATLGSFFINSIIDAIHIATFIASASYFFVLMGGLYWKRATGPGAVASLWTGFTVQVGLVIFDLIKTPPRAPAFLEGIHPIFMGHGVIIAMAISGIVFVGVSLMTDPSKKEQLAPFFKDEAENDGAL